MGKTNNKSKVSIEFIALVKHNIRKRLRHLKVSPRKASIESGHHHSWLSDILSDRYRYRISAGTFAEAAHALGVPIPKLCSEKFYPDLIPNPQWMRDEKTEDDNEDKSLTHREDIW
jgi:hypothetical protein